MAMPKHVGVVLDGNRRFAKKLMLQPWKGHEWGAEKVRSLIEWSYQANIKELTLYAFSEQNFNRPKDEFNFLMKLFTKTFDKLSTGKDLEDINKKGLRINFIGRIHKFPDYLVERINNLMEVTKHNTEYQLNIAMAYGGREELIDAIKVIGRKLENNEITSEDVDNKLINDSLYMKGSPDLIIRTGGEKRTSNFLIWQAAYSEWIFLEKPWPEFEKEDFISCLNEYDERERRFGK